MSLRVILSFLRKEFLQILRAREMIAVIFVLPIIQLLIMGFAVSNEVKHVRIAFIDYDNSAVSRDLIRSFATTDRFDLVDPGDESSPDEILRDWRAQLVVVIPAGFARDLAKNRFPAVQVAVDGIDGNTASIASNYALGIVRQYLTTQTDELDPSLLLRMRRMTGARSVNVISRMWYNPELRSSYFIVPGIIAILVTIGSMLLSAMSLVKEKELGTMEQLLVTPVRKTELMIGKLLPFWIMTMIQLTVAVLFAGIVFGIRASGSLAGLYLFSGLFLFSTLGLGIIISTLTSSQQQAMFFCWFALVFMILLGGLFVPVQNMPAGVKALAAINPLNHFITVVREIVIKGSPIGYLKRELLILIGFGILFFGSAVMLFRKRV